MTNEVSDKMDRKKGEENKLLTKSQEPHTSLWYTYIWLTKNRNKIEEQEYSFRSAATYLTIFIGMLFYFIFMWLFFLCPIHFDFDLVLAVFPKNDQNDRRIQMTFWCKRWREKTTRSKNWLKRYDHMLAWKKERKKRM